MKNWFALSLSLYIGLLACTLIAQDAQPIAYDKLEARKLFGDFKFTEGPAEDGAGNIYFSDIPANHIYKIDNEGKLSKFLEASNHTNGLMFASPGKLLACEMDGRLVAIDIATKTVTSLADKHNAARFNAPNDLVIDSQEGIYFTDPRFRAPEPWPQGKEAWYYRAANGNIVRLGDNLPAPNGVILAPNEKTLYIVPSMQKQIMAYPISEPGVVGTGKVFCELAQKEATGNGGGDGLSIDVAGNLYITTGLGIQVFSAEGKALGIIKVPEHPANCAFGGKDYKTLYITARTGIYAVDLPIAGHRFGKWK
jgi:gluconolactonase